MWDQLRFEHEGYLYGLLLIPLLVVLFVFMQYRKRKALRQWGDSRTRARFLIEPPTYKRWVKLGLLAVAVGLLSLGLANLQYGSKEQEVKQKGVDVVIALDLSKSMLTEDVEPNRLQKAQYFIRQVLNELVNDRVGLIVFAGNAYMQMPLTVDYSAANLFLNSVSTEMVPTQGTAIGDALELSMKAFDENQKQHQAVVIISDGENHSGDALKAAKKAHSKGITIHTVGVGTKKGAPIPVKAGSGEIEFVRNKKGEVVVSQLNAGILRQIADKGGGVYLPLVNNRQTVKAFDKALNQMEQRKFDKKVYTDYSDHFQYFLAGTLLLLLVEFLLPERSSKVFKKLNL
jgi:Ca-activated chloride channel family protein